MLSEHNIEKINFNGLYTCEANAKYRGRFHADNLFHCCNWTFEVKKNHEGNYFMRDTYWSSGDSAVHIPLTDENFDEFKLIFDRSRVKRIKKHELKHYESTYTVGIDSGGWSYPKYFVDIDAVKSKQLIIKEIDNEISSLERQIKRLQEQKEGLIDGSYKLKWV